MRLNQLTSSKMQGWQKLKRNTKQESALFFSRPTDKPLMWQCRTWKDTSMANRSQFDNLILLHSDDRGWDDDILAVVCSSMLMNRIGIGLSMRRPPCWLLIHFIEMYSAAELNISNDKKWLAQLGQWMGIGPKNEAAAVVAPTVPNHCLVHIPPPEPCPVLDWQLQNICPATSSDCSLLVQLWGFVDFEWSATVKSERLMYGDQALSESQIWDFRRRVNGLRRILTNSVSQSLILGWKAVTRAGAWDRPHLNPTFSTPSSKSGRSCAGTNYFGKGIGGFTNRAKDYAFAVCSYGSEERKNKRRYIKSYIF